MESRYLTSTIKQDLNQKMVFVSGPRQVGKTTLAKKIGTTLFDSFSYLNWDNNEDKKIILNSIIPADTKLIIFDEIHKYGNWKTYLKGIYDKHHEDFSILVTGSARLDIYKKGGDSLLGRYFNLRLHPFSLAEMQQHSPKTEPLKELNFTSSTKTIIKNWQLLNKFGGFPEPLIKQDSKNLRRWQNHRIERLIKEDVRDLTMVREIGLMEVLADNLKSKVGSKLSINSLREDLQLNHKTVSTWLDTLENFYYHFRIYPFGSDKIKALKKEAKLYLWDWSTVEEEGAKFENIIASHLLKYVHYLYDVEGYKAQLHYIRDIEGRATDFLVTIDNKPWFAVEAKLSDQKPSNHLHYFAEKLKIPFSFQVINTPNQDYYNGKTRIISADKFMTALV